jgi:translation initiation factor 2 beta subunit (eIF-2beta)/eIF-5
LLLLQRLKDISNVRLFVTSRQNFQDITEALNAYPQLIISAHDSDLQYYMRQEMLLAGVEDIVDDVLTIEIIEKVINKAQGM